MHGREEDKINVLQTAAEVEEKQTTNIAVDDPFSESYYALEDDDKGEISSPLVHPQNQSQNQNQNQSPTSSPFAKSSTSAQDTTDKDWKSWDEA